IGLNIGGTIEAAYTRWRLKIESFKAQNNISEHKNQKDKMTSCNVLNQGAK
ncbi:18154_t:CDS:1, partial [Racocetra fulgida]